MYLQNSINIDSVKEVQDSLKSASSNDNVMNSVNFNFSNIGADEIILTVLGYSIVFIALLVLYLFFFNLSKILKLNIRKKLRALGKEPIESEEIISGETAAAISLALSLHFQEAHDIENTIITIKKMQSTYSPWNSKLHGLRQYPRY